MRSPSDRTALWDRWRRRVAGERAGPISEQAECGRYKAKRNGQWVAVQIDIEQEIEGGELISEERLVAFVQGERFDDPDRVAAIWLRCADKPINDDEFRALMDLPRISDLTRSIVI